MKYLKHLSLVLIVVLLCGCQNKYNGTWCLYTEIPSTLVILKDKYNEDDYKKIEKYLKSLSNMSSYDLIDNIESANKMINIYYTNKENIDVYKDVLSKNNAVKSVENKMINKAKEKIIIKRKKYTYGKELNTLYASETKGKLSINNNTITLDDTTNLYYKDNFLCKDIDCNTIFTKSNNNCNG